jgi:hypothetical protein
MLTVSDILYIGGLELTVKRGVFKVELDTGLSSVPFQVV